MTGNHADFRNMLEQNPDLKKDLFIRGFLITDQKIDGLQEFPFYGNWTLEEYSGFYFMCHERAHMTVYMDAGNRCFFLMGHAYNPFTMKYRELEILEEIAGTYGTEDYMERIHDLTGVFVYGTVVDGRMDYLVDPSGMQSACSGKVGGAFYLTSHPQLVGDLCGLKMDCFVEELVAYKWYRRVMGPYLPADLTPFSELKRVIPSIYYHYNGTISNERYWPLKPAVAVQSEQEYEKVIQKAATILRNNMMLVSKKWEHPWISMTGGIDSNTTFAAANGFYNQFETFSYVSAEKEVPDAEAAKRISENFGLKHHEYYIPDNNSDTDRFMEKRELFRHNNGYVAELYDNEARKKFFLRENTSCDVEVKSWVSETIRAYWYKHYGRKSMPMLSAKLYRNLYKIFLCNRRLAHKVDRIFEEYIDTYEYRKIPSGYPPADMHYNEVTWGSWGGLNISEMKYCFDITFIYNNRRFLDLMFSVPLEKRISDQHHLDLKRYLNPELYDMGIRVVNQKETRFRAFALNVIFTLNMLLPF